MQTVGQQRLRGGFTLVELLVVVVIIGILAGGVFMMTRAAGSKSAEAKTITQVHAIASLLSEYKSVYGEYPLVTEADDKGYASLNFTFLANSASCKYCGTEIVSYDKNGEKGNDKVSFGLCSHFVPRATTIQSYTSGMNMESYYQTQFKSPSSNSAFEREYEGVRDNTLARTVEFESVDINLQQINRVWKRLKAQGLVYEGISGCDECDMRLYIAGANKDAWGNALKYHNVGGAGEIVSAGPDGTFGTSDDITSGGAAAEDDDD